MNLFGTVLTYTAPSANYRGENAENRAVIQKITKGRFEYPIISPEAMRNALRETLAELGLPCNRSRLHDEEQLAVRFKTYPDKNTFADDFFFGWLIAAKKAERHQHQMDLILSDNDKRGDELKEKATAIQSKISAAGAKARNTAEKEGKDAAKKEQKKAEKELEKVVAEFSGLVFRSDSLVRMNMAVGLEPYRHNTVFTQSPDLVESPWKNAKNSQLLHRETAVTPYQYPFALNLSDCTEQPEWTKTLLKAIGQLNSVAGNHARSYFEFAPASIVLRLTPQLVAGYDSYGFRVADEQHTLPEIIDGITAEDFSGDEFYLGGTIVKQLTEAQHAALQDKGVTLDRNPQRLLETVGNNAFK